MSAHDDEPRGVHVRSHPRGAHAPGAEEIEAVASAFRGAAMFLDACRMRPTDVAWWERETRSIVASMREQARVAALTDDAVAAMISPEERETGGSFGGRMTAADVAKRVAAIRRACGWIISLGGLSVGIERIVMESIMMDRDAQRARQQVRAFVAVAEMAVGMASIARTSDSDDDTAEGTHAG